MCRPQISQIHQIVLGLSCNSKNQFSQSNREGLYCLGLSQESKQVSFIISLNSLSSRSRHYPTVPEGLVPDSCGRLGHVGTWMADQYHRVVTDRPQSGRDSFVKHLEVFLIKLIGVVDCRHDPRVRSDFGPAIFIGNRVLADRNGINRSGLNGVCDIKEAEEGSDEKDKFHRNQNQQEILWELSEYSPRQQGYFYKHPNILQKNTQSKVDNSRILNNKNLPIMETKKLIVVDCYSLSNKFSKDCPVCAKPVVYMASHSFCGCNTHYHSKCLMLQLNKKNLSEEPQVQCLYCRAYYQIQYRVDFFVGYNKNKCTCKNLMVAAFALLSLVTLIISLIVATALMSTDNVVGVYISFSVMAASVVAVSLLGSKAILTFFTQKRVSVVNVKPNDKSLEFSAFKDMRGTIDYQSDYKLDSGL